MCEPSPFLTRSHVKYLPLMNFQVEMFGGKYRFLEIFKWKKFSISLANSLGFAAEEPIA